MKYFVIQATQNGGFRIRRQFFNDTVVIDPVFYISEVDVIANLAIACGIVAEKLDPHCISETNFKFQPVIEGREAYITCDGHFDWFPDVFFPDLEFQFNGAVARELSYALTQLVQMAIEANIVASIAVAA